jgi:hypothetical protein
MRATSQKQEGENWGIAAGQSYHDFGSDTAWEKRNKVNEKVTKGPASFKGFELPFKGKAERFEAGLNRFQGLFH